MSVAPKPVLVLQHLSDDGPATLADWLREQGHAMDLRDAEAGDAYPTRLDGYAALAILGGEMSANDDLPGLRRAEALVREAVREAIPVIGHCLGGQLIARALGASVTPNPAGPEIGWHRIDIAAAAPARHWFGSTDEHTVFQWHRETFALPPGATLLASSAHCAHQAFSLGPHLALQFHLELDAAKLSHWTRDEPVAPPPGVAAGSVQAAGAMRAADAALAAQQALARRVYGRWRQRWR